MIDPLAIRATVVLCDSAQVIDGKLYVLGGGWTIMTKVAPVTPTAVAILVDVPWQMGNQRHSFKLSLTDYEGTPVMAGDNAIEVLGSFETGRHAALMPESGLVTTMAFQIQLDLPAGGYQWEFRLGETVVGIRRFQVVVPTQQTFSSGNVDAG